MFGLFKMILIGIICFIAFIVIVCMSIFASGDPPKDKIINTYDSIIQSFDSAGLTNNSELNCRLLQSHFASLRLVAYGLFKKLIFCI